MLEMIMKTLMVLDMKYIEQYGSDPNEYLEEMFEEELKKRKLLN